MTWSGSRFIGATSFILVAVTFTLLLLNSLRQGELSIVELFFWAILLIGCARLFGAILRALVGGLRADRA